jgi:outer membrane protein assembly factor BamB
MMQKKKKGWFWIALLLLVTGCGNGRDVSALPTLVSPSLPTHLIDVIGQSMTALDGDTGHLAWSAPITASNVESVALTASMLYVGRASSQQGGVIALDQKTGQQRWVADTGPVIAVYTTLQRVIVIGQNVITALDSNTGALLWHQMAATSETSNAVAMDGSLIFTASGQTVQAFRTSDGGVAWQHTPMTTTDPSCANLRPWHDLLMCNSYGRHIAWHIQDGTLAWELDAPQFQEIGQQGDVLYGVARAPLVQMPNTIMAVNMSTGTIRWTSSLMNGVITITQAAALSADGRQLILAEGPQGGDVTSLDTTAGLPQWTQPSLGMVGKLVSGGSYVYAFYQSSLHALDLATGILQWNLPLANALNAVSLVDQGQFIIADNGIVFADDLTGKRLWQQSLDTSAVQQIMSVVS